MKTWDWTYTDRALDALPKWVLAALVQELAATNPDCASADDPAEVQRVILLRLRELAAARPPADGTAIRRAAGPYVRALAKR